MIKMNFNLQYPLSHPLNEVNKKKFIAASAPDARNAIRKFIKVTKHISFETFINYINQNLQDVVEQLEEDRPIFVYIDDNLPNHKMKSNYWLYLYINQLATQKYNKTVHELTHLNKRVIKDNDIILLVDDCLYSGTQMAQTVLKIDNPKRKRLHFIVFVPFLSHAGCNNVEEAFYMNNELDGCTISLSKHVSYIKPLADYMNEDEYISIIKYYKDYQGKTFRLFMDAEEDLSKYPIYFDHKLADSLSTFPKIYGGLVPNEHNLKLVKDIDLLSKELSQSEVKPNREEWNQRMTALKNRFQIIPMITHCENINKYDEYACPVPPYKTGLFDNFLQTIKQGAKSQTHSSSSSSTRKYRSTNSAK
jgi:hypothetical protein